MRRPATHQLGEMAELKVREAFLKAGWLVHKLNPDYGIDLMVQRATPKRKKVTGDVAFFQVKGCQNISLSEDKTKVSHRIETKYLKFWQSVRIPTMLAIYESSSGNTYVAACSELVKSLEGKFGKDWRRAKTRTIHILSSSILTQELIDKIGERLRRFWSEYSTTAAEFGLMHRLCRNGHFRLHNKIAQIRSRGTLKSRLKLKAFTGRIGRI